MWTKIYDPQDINDLMKQVYGFHDSCIKEMRFLGDGYVLDNLCMAQAEAVLRSTCMYSN